MMRLAILALAFLASIVAAWAEFPFASPKIRNSGLGGSPLISQTDYTAGSLGSGDSDTRGSVASYYNSSGVLSSAAINVARFDFDPGTLAARGWLVEAAATQLNIYTTSATIVSNWSTLAAALATSGVNDPSGVAAAKITASAGTTASEIYKNNPATSANTNYTCSWDVLQGTNRYVFVGAQGSSQNWATSVFDVGASNTAATQTLVGSTSGTVVSTFQYLLAGGWYRVGMVFKTGVSATYCYVGQAKAATGNTTDSNGQVIGTYAGTETLNLAFSQMALGSFISSTIPNATGSSVTRSADTAANSNWWNGSTGNYLMVESESESTPGTITRSSYCNSGCTGTSFSAPVSVWIRRICQFSASTAGATSAQTAAGQANGTVCT